MTNSNSSADIADILSGYTFEMCVSELPENTILAIQLEIAENLTGQEWLVCDATHADNLARERALELAWAFRAEFVADYATCSRSDAIVDAIRIVQQKLCEGAQDFVLALLGENVGAFVQDAIDTDGRGHFLSQYDSEEREIRVDGQRFYAYRQA
jgi:hypothetical protein